MSSEELNHGSKSVPGIFARAFDEPWMIEGRAGTAVRMAAMRMAAGETVSDAEIEAASKFGSRGPMGDFRAELKAEKVRVGGHAEYTRVGSVAVIDVWGVLDKTDADVTRDTWDGPVRIGTSYESIRRSLHAARADNAVSSIVMRFDSPGGSAHSVGPLSDEIFDAASATGTDAAGRPAGKMVVAYADDLMASAALYLGAQANKLYGSPGSWVGSIGTIRMHVDFSKMLDRIGVTVTAIKSTPSKDTGAEYRPLNEQDRTLLQKDVNAFDAQFVAAMARGRKVDEQTVRAWASQRGFVGASAVTAGLSDGIRSSIEAVIAELQGGAGAAGVGRNQNNNGRRVAAVHAGPSAQGDDAMNAKMLLENAGGPDGAGGGGAGGASAGAGGTTNTVNAGEVEAKTLAAERSRVALINTRAGLFAGNDRVASLATQAVKDGWTEAKFADETINVLAEQAKPTGHVPGGGKQTTIGGSLSITADARDNRNRGFGMALMGRVCSSEMAKIRSGDAKAEQLSHTLGFESSADFRKEDREFTSSGARGLSLAYIMASCIAHSAAAAGMVSCREGDFAGVLRSFTDGQRFMAAAAHSSSDFPLLLSTAANKRLLSGYGEVATVWDKVCYLGSASDYKSRDLISLSDISNFEDIGENGTPKEMTFNERKESIRVGASGIRYSLTYQAVRNDDLSGFSRITQSIGQAARRAPENAFITLLTSNSGTGPTMSDTVAMFNAAHANTDSGAALGQATLEAAWTKLRTKKGFGPDAAPIEIMPRIILVPVQLELLAGKLVSNEYAVGTEGAQLLQNVMRGRLTPFGTPRLTNTTRWYLFADPASVPAFQMDFLDGVQTPEITPINDGDPMAMRYQATIRGFGCAAVQFEGAYMNPGA